MGKILYLVHRMPYPPNKGDKVRSYHLLRHLASKHQVFLGTFIDDPEDDAHVDTLREWCSDIHIERLHPKLARLASLRGLLGRSALTLCYYQSRGLSRWVQQISEKHQLDAVVVFSSSMAQYAESLRDVPMLVDFVDVDSAKWTQYASERSWPLSWLFRREGRCLLAYEQALAMKARQSFFVTDSETALFRQLAPQAAAKVQTICNGVDSQFFSANAARSNPFRAGEKSIVFTGAMDYWPNVDAVRWFSNDILPIIRKTWPGLRFYIVGRNPDVSVQSLGSGGVVVTGTVPDVRPYLQYADVVVAPLRLARGIQNKILEAMSMGRPVVASGACVSAIQAQPRVDIVSAESVEEYVMAINEILSDPLRAQRLGVAARDCVVRRYSWSAHLAGIDQYLDQ